MKTIAKRFEPAHFILRDLANRSEAAVLGDGNALDCELLRKSLLLALNMVEIQSQSDLLDAERILDMLGASGLGNSIAAEKLLAKAEACLRANPILVNDAWPRCDGAVYQLVQNLRAECEMRHVLARFKLQKTS